MSDAEKGKGSPGVIPELMAKVSGGNPHASVPAALPTFDLGSGLYDDGQIQNGSYRKIDIINVVFHVIGGILAVFSNPWSIIGTIVYTIGVVPLMFVWIFVVPTRHLRRRSAAGLDFKSIGYSTFWVLFSILWYLGFWFAAMVTYSTVASKSFFDETGGKVTGFILALIQWCCIAGTVRSSMLVFQSGFAVGGSTFCLPDLTVVISPGGGHTFTSSIIDIKYEDIKTLVVATSKESFKTVRTTESGNTRTTTTTTWSRNVLWVAFRCGARGEEAYGFPVSATGGQTCNGYCCTTLERWAERGVLRFHAKEFLDVIKSKRSDLATQVDAIKTLIDNTVEV